MLKAAFIDRDGVINELIYNINTSSYESPHDVSDLKIIEGAFQGLRIIQAKGFELFIISNQPSYAKGKVSLEKLQDIAKLVETKLAQETIQIREIFYCYHHPEGIVPELTKICDCRKPGAFFLFNAQKNYNLNLAESWMIGDQDSDILCGKNAGCKTILIENPYSSSKRVGLSSPDHRAKNLLTAALKL